MDVRTRNELKKEVNEYKATITEVSGLVEEALDPELTREELVAKVKEIQEALPEEEEEEGGQDKD
jgi:seryl-tRNA synthetase